MTHWKKKGVSSTITGPPLPSSVHPSNRSAQRGEKDFNSTAETDDDDLHSANLSTYLLFPKESPIGSKEPLFPTSRKKFLMMTCKRTLLGCRGLILFCLIVFVVISLVASHSGQNNDTNSLSSVSKSGNAAITNSTTIRNDAKDHQHRLETLLLPPSVTGNANGNTSEATVSYNINCMFRSTDYAVVANALRKGLEFYEENEDKITVLDAALGTRIATEQLKKIETSHKQLPLSLKSFIHDLATKANNLTEHLTQTVKLASANKTDELKLTLPWIEMDGLWNLPVKQWHPVGKLMSYIPPNGESFEELWAIASRKEIIDEHESDTCIYQVFHCDTANITERCKEVFLSKESSMYSLTHQVIYMLLAQKNKCYEKLTWKDVPSLKESGYPFLEKLCGKVWQEANSIAESNFPPRFRDLFAEQIGMCALSGYSDFFRRDWLRRIISWQSIGTSGCFGDKRRRVPPSIGLLLKEYHRVQENIRHEKDLNFGRKHEGHFGHRHQHKAHFGRYKRSDMFLNSETDKEKCSVHFTSVGITALVMHLRYLFDTCFDAYN